MKAKRVKTDYAQLELLIPDYLNGVATDEQRVAIEKAANESVSFRETLESDRALFTRMRSQDLSTQAQPSFSDIADKVHRRSHWLSPGLGWSSAAAMALLLMVGIGTWTGDQVAFDDFETLSTETVGYENPTLRVIGASDVSADELRKILQSHKLIVEQAHPSLGVFDVSRGDSIGLKEVADKLKNDPRFRSVSFLTGAAE